MKIVITIMFVLLVGAMILGPGVGYILNIVKLCQCDFEAPIKAEIIRGIGIIAPPVGMVAGWCTIEDGPKND